MSTKEPSKTEDGQSRSTVGLGAWISTSWQLPSDETPVLIFRNGEICVGERRWDYPGFEDTYRAFWYWDDPNDDGRAWEDNNDVTHWMPLPAAPNAVLRGEPLAASPLENIVMQQLNEGE